MLPPARRRSAARRPAASAATSSKGRTRPSKSSISARAKASSRIRRRRPDARISRPKRTSKTVMAVVHTDSGGRRSSHVRTTRSGSRCMTAERIFVSNRITVRAQPDAPDGRAALGSVSEGRHQQSGRPGANQEATEDRSHLSQHCGESREPLLPCSDHAGGHGAEAAPSRHRPTDAPPVAPCAR